MNDNQSCEKELTGDRMIAGKNLLMTTCILVKCQEGIVTEWHLPSMWRVYSGALSQYTLALTASSLTAWSSCHTLAPDWRGNCHIWPLIGQHTSELAPDWSGPWDWSLVLTETLWLRAGWWEVRTQSDTTASRKQSLSQRDICYWLVSSSWWPIAQISSWWWWCSVNLWYWWQYYAPA